MMQEDIKIKEIITIQKAQALDIFTKRELITPLLEKIEHVATQEVFDAGTDKGRKSIASMAYRVAQSKTYIESHGKELAAELKELPKLVDSSRKYAKDFLDALKDRVRKPLDDWEAEQAAIKLKKEIEEKHEEAMFDNIEWELKRKAERDRLDKERADYEAKVLADAEVKAKIAAEERARKEIIEAEARALLAEREAIRVKEKAEFDIKEARIKAEQLIIQEEFRRKRELDDENNRKAIKENVDKVHQSIINDFLAIRLNDKQAAYILDAILAKKIKALTINY
jgi:colicin import membrane protein